MSQNFSTSASECCKKTLTVRIVSKLYIPTSTLLFFSALEYTGGVPYDLLKPVLERASAQQLYSLENFNPYLLEDTGELWKQLCQKECKTAVRNYDETWRDVYLVMMFLPDLLTQS